MNEFKFTTNNLQTILPDVLRESERDFFGEKKIDPQVSLADALGGAKIESMPDGKFKVITKEGDYIVPASFDEKDMSAQDGGAVDKSVEPKEIGSDKVEAKEKLEMIDSLKLDEIINDATVGSKLKKHRTFTIKPGQVWKNKNSSETFTIEYIGYDLASYKHSVKFKEKKTAEMYGSDENASELGYQNQIVKTFSNLKRIDGPDSDERIITIGAVFDEKDPKKAANTLRLNKDGIITQNVKESANDNDHTASLFGQKEPEITIQSIADPVVNEHPAEEIVRKIEEKDPAQIIANDFKIEGLDINNPQHIEALNVFQASLVKYDADKDEVMLDSAKKQLEKAGIRINIADRVINFEYIKKFNELIDILKKKSIARRQVNHPLDGALMAEKAVVGQSMVLEHKGTKFEIEVGDKFKVNGAETILTILNIDKKENGEVEIRFDNIEDPATMSVADWAQMFSDNLTEVNDNGTI